MKEEFQRAIAGADRVRLPEIAKAVWAEWAAGQLSDDEAQALAEMVELRKAMGVSSSLRKPRPIGSRPRSPASMERRRSWTAGGWAPPSIQAWFTMGEAAALAVIVAEIAARGSCILHVGAIAGRAGVGETTVRNARRQAVALGLLHVVEDRKGYDRSGPNCITILSRELALWVRTRARVEAKGWVQDRVADLQPLSSLHGGRARTAPFRGKSMKRIERSTPCTSTARRW